MSDREYPENNLAWGIVYHVKHNLSFLGKIYKFKVNDLVLFDSIIFASFLIKETLSREFFDKEKAKNVVDGFFTRVLEYYPEGQTVSEIYAKKFFPNKKMTAEEQNSIFFSERINFYNYIFNEARGAFENRIKIAIEEFEHILAYDLAEKCIRFNKNTPLMLADIEMQFKISAIVDVLHSSLADGDIKYAIQYALECYNSYPTIKQMFKKIINYFKNTLNIQRN